MEKGRAKGRGLQCLEEAQSIVAGFTSSVSDLLPVIPYVRFTILQSSAPSGQSIPAFGRPLLQGGTRFKLNSILRGASIFLCAAPPLLTPHSELASRAFTHNQRAKFESRHEWLGIRDWGLGVTSDWDFSGIVIPSAVEGSFLYCGNQRVCAEGKRCLGAASHQAMSVLQ